MRRTVLVAVVLVMNVADTPSSTREEQAIPPPGSRTAPDRPGPVPPPDLQGFPTRTAPNELATVALPSNFSDVTALFDRLPLRLRVIRVRRSLIASLPGVQPSATARTGG